MKKQKIYLDTSVISHLFANDAMEKMVDTLKLWKEIEQGRFDVYLSNLTIEELNECAQPKQDILYEHLSRISYQQISVDEEAFELANRIVEVGILTKKSFDDCVHIACAILKECNYILSWNFKHLVNVKTINGIRAITHLSGYKQVDIITPTMLIEGEES